MSFPCPIADIVVLEGRQRETFEDIEDLALSLQQIGQITPIVIGEGNVLIAGERRLRAAKHLGWTTIRAELLSLLEPTDREIVELEENVKRAQLTWQENARAAARIHFLLEQKNPEWSRSSTAKALSISTQHLSRFIMVAEAMEQNPKIAEIASLSTAVNFIARADERKLSDVVSGIVNLDFSRVEEAEAEAIEQAEDEERMLEVLEPSAAPKTNDGVIAPTPAPVQVPAAPKSPTYAILPPEKSLLGENFLEWSKTYSGAPFNLIHTDFPYAAGAGKASSQINAGGELGSYSDSKEIFWTLCQALMDSMSNVVAPSAHIMVWHATALFPEVHAFFKSYEETHDLRVFPIPLIWHKTDNTGVVSDAARRPRHIYESALFISRGDRKIIQPLADVYGAPASRSIHPAEKPVPMLQHFFRMLVSDTTRMLDPTAGSGTSLRAAEALGAQQVLGLEIDPGFLEAARAELASFRRKNLLANLEKN